MASVKDMLFQLTELKRDNDDLKEQNSLLVAQQSQMLQQHAWFSQQINWCQKQLLDTQAQFGDCYHQYSLCSLELYNLKTSVAVPTVAQPCSVNPEWNQMLAADIESHQLDRHYQVELKHTLFNQQQMLLAEVESHRAETHSQTKKVEDLLQSKRVLKEDVLLSNKKVSALGTQMLELSACLQQSTKELQQRGNQLTQVKKQLKDEQDKLKNKNKEARNQQETIHTLQNNLVQMTEQLAEAERFVKSAKNDVAIATNLSNGLSNKCLKLQEEQKAQREEQKAQRDELRAQKEEHKAHIETLNGIVDGLKQQLEGQRASTKKLVQRAVEQQKTINKLSKVSVVFQADAETTESVIKESYTDLQKFIEEKALQMERIVALVAYAIVHLKYVLERFVTEQFEEKTPENIMHKEFLNQIVNHLTRVFQLVPVPVMTRNIDRLEEFAALEKINIRSLHVIQYMLPVTMEDAKASRQRVVLENFPHLNKFFIDEHCTDGDTISMSVQGFMMLLGISK